MTIKSSNTKHQKRTSKLTRQTRAVKKWERGREERRARYARHLRVEGKINLLMGGEAIAGGDVRAYLQAPRPGVLADAAPQILDAFRLALGKFGTQGSPIAEAVASVMPGPPIYVIGERVVVLYIGSGTVKRRVLEAGGAIVPSWFYTVALDDGSTCRVSEPLMSRETPAPAPVASAP